MDHESDVPQHEANEIKLTAFALGELTEAERAAFLAQSLDAAADLQALAEIARVGELIRRARREEGYPERSSELRQTLEARLTEAAAPTLLLPPSRSRPPRHLWLPLSLAASALVIGGTAVALMQVRHADERQIALAGLQGVEQPTGVANLTARSRLEDSVELSLDAESLDFGSQAERRDGQTDLKRSKEKTPLGFGLAESEKPEAAASVIAVDGSAAAAEIAPTAGPETSLGRGFSLQQLDSLSTSEMPLGGRAIVPATGSGGSGMMGGMGGGMGRLPSQFGGYVAPQRQNTMNYGRPAAGGQPQTADGYYYFAKPRAATAGASGAAAPASGDVMRSRPMYGQSEPLGEVGEIRGRAGAVSPATQPALPAIAALEEKELEQQIAEGIPAAVRFGEADQSAESYAAIVENPFVKVVDSPLSTFSIDVDTASYANVRRFLNSNSLPPPDAVRIEELINYFQYSYPQPEGDVPFSVNTEVAGCPWNAEHRLLRVGLKGREIAVERRPASNLVFLLDVSGSMNEPNKLPLVKEAMLLLTEQLGENDHVSIVVYAGNSGLVLPPTNGANKRTIEAAISGLSPGGSTNGGEGIQTAYATAQANFIKQGVNRVILATDGDFNVGVTDQNDLVRLVEEQARGGVFFSALGFGTGNLKDGTLEKLADKGNGNYAYIDTLGEARKVLVEQLSGTLVTIAKDVKLQIEFNPAQVDAFRLIGYENRVLAHADFNDDRKDAGDVGAGHTVTALYELVPPGKAAGVAAVDELKYQRVAPAFKPAAESDELLTLKLRYKQPDGDKSRLLEHVIADSGKKYGQASRDFKFASAVAAFGMLLRHSPNAGDANLDAVLELAGEGLDSDLNGYRAEFIALAKKAKELASPK
ncbi:MAG TPA: VWA domain-containing protein [Pirellulales bacterium]|nr:VWA domain-containing protein [Pirellulales bacterium]